MIGFLSLKSQKFRQVLFTGPTFRFIECDLLQGCLVYVLTLQIKHGTNTTQLIQFIYKK